MAPTLLLFDVDGTLVGGASEAHAAALRGAVEAVHGVNARGVRLTVPVAGRTDGELARLILLGAGVSAERIDARAARVREECCRMYARLVPDDLSHSVLGGIPELLEDLSGRDDIILGLLTGNFEPVARLKLARAGIGHRFAGCPGAFGSDHEDRAALPAIARRRAGGAGVPHPRAQTVIIGDTPRDIACARADELRCIAVATGPYGVDELSDADAVAEDATAIAAALERLL